MRSVRTMRRRVALVAVGVLLAGSGVTAVAPAAVAVSGPDWLVAVNAYRADVGLPPVVEDAALSAKDAAHVRWMAANHVLSHGETPGTASYSTDGAYAGMHSNVSMGEPNPVDAIDGWMVAPFHALGILRPGLTAVGFAYDPSSRFAALDVLSATGGSAGPAVRSWPSRRAVSELTFPPFETPDPTVPCGSPTGSRFGTPILVTLGQEWTTARVTSATLSGPGGNVPLCAVSGASFAQGSTEQAILDEQAAVLVFPRSPLMAAASYTGRVVTDLGTANVAFSTVGGPVTPPAEQPSPQPSGDPSPRPAPTPAPGVVRKASVVTGWPGVVRSSKSSVTLSVRISPVVPRTATLQTRACSSCAWRWVRYIAVRSATVTVAVPVARTARQYRLVVQATPAAAAAATGVLTTRR